MEEKEYKKESVNKNFLGQKRVFVKNYGGVKPMIATILVSFQQVLYKLYNNVLNLQHNSIE